MRPLFLMRAAILAVACAAGLSAQTPNYPTVITLLRQADYQQTSAQTSGPMTSYQLIGGSFARGVGVNAFLTLATPVGRYQVTVTSAGSFSGQLTYASPAALFGDMPDGDYSLILNDGLNSSITNFTVSGSSQAVPALIANYSALQNWTQPSITVNWPATGTTSTDLQTLTAYSTAGTQLSKLSSNDGSLSATATSATFLGLPALSGYIFYLDFARNSVQTANGGATTIVLGNAADLGFSVVRGTAAPPAISVQPAGGTVPPGSTFIFQVSAADSSGAGLTYQWSRNGVAISGATSSSYEIIGAQVGDAGNYTVAITGTGGTVTSTAAALAVAATADPGRIINLSIRTVAGTGDQVLSAGFVVGGGASNGTQAVLIRGIGPTLGTFGLQGTLADPALQLFPQPANPVAIATNDDWGASTQATQISAVSAQVGAFALATTSKDAVLYLPTLAGGGYSAVVTGNAGGTGVALAEVYDATPAGAYTSSKPHLINVSGKSQVGVGANALFGGFTIGGTTSKTILIRASGPALTPFGINGVLANPQLDLYNQATPSAPPIATNIGWGGDANIIAAAAAVQAFAWSNGRSADSALLVTLPPGGYSAQVSGVNQTTGIALLEIYELP